MALARAPGLDGLTLLAPVRLNVVCFTPAEEPTRERVPALARAVAASGETYLTPTVYQGPRGCGRRSATGVRRRDDVERGVGAIRSALAEVRTI